MANLPMLKQLDRCVALKKAIEEKKCEIQGGSQEMAVMVG